MLWFVYAVSVEPSRFLSLFSLLLLFAVLPLYVCETRTVMLWARILYFIASLCHCCVLMSGFKTGLSAQSVSAWGERAPCAVPSCKFFILLPFPFYISEQYIHSYPTSAYVLARTSIPSLRDGCAFFVTLPWHVHIFRTRMFTPYLKRTYSGYSRTDTSVNDIEYSHSLTL